MDFRQYFMIESTKPLKIRYFNGFGRVSLIKYSPSAFTEASQLTNLETSKKFSKDKKIENLEGEPIDEFMVKTMGEVKYTLAKDYKIDLDRHLKNLKKIIKRIIESTRITDQKSSSFQLFAADYGITDDNKGYLMEVNAYPKFSADSEKKEKIYSKLFEGYMDAIERKVRMTKYVVKKQFQKMEFDHEKAMDIVSKYLMSVDKEDKNLQ